MTRPIWIACGEKPAIYGHRQGPIVVQKHQQRQRKPAMALCINLWLLKTPFFARRPKHHPHPAANPLKTGHRRARHQFTFRHTPQDARSPRRTPHWARSALYSFSPNPRRPRTKGPEGFPSECIPQHEAPSKCAKRAIFSPASNPPKTGHRRARHRLTFRHTPQDARSPRRTKCAARASCISEDVPKSKLMADPDDYRAIDYPVFCSPAETPVTVERIRLMYSAFFSSAISSWFIRTSRRARTWAMDRAST